MYMYNIPYFLVLHFGENFMKIRTKIAKVQIHGNLHKLSMKTCFHSHFYANFHEFYGGQLGLQRFIEIVSYRIVRSSHDTLTIQHLVLYIRNDF